MSKLLKKIGKGIKKVFKAVKKVVKKVFSSKIFKAVAIAATLMFAAPAVAGTLSGSSATAAAGSSLSASATTAAGAGVTGSKLAAIAGSSYGAGAAATGFGAKIAAIGGWAQANPMLASTILTTGGTMIAGYAQNKAARDAYEEQKNEMAQNAQTQLPIKDRLGKYSNLAPTTSKPKVTGYYYDEHQDSYKPAGG